MKQINKSSVPEKLKNRKQNFIEWALHQIQILQKKGSVNWNTGQLKLFKLGLGWKKMTKKGQKETFGDKTFHILIVVVVAQIYLLAKVIKLCTLNGCILFKLYLNCSLINLT